MGIGAVLGSILKGISWAKVASVAMEYAPDLYRQAKERFQQSEPAAESAVETELHDRISRLEKLLLEQEDVIREHTAKAARLEEICNSLESRLLTFKVISGTLLVASLTMLFLLLK